MRFLLAETAVLLEFVAVLRVITNCILAAAILLFGPLVRAADEADAARDRDVEQLTGARTRVVWMRDTSAGAKSFDGVGTGFLLMGYDSRDGRGLRPILAEKGSYFRPLITPDGAKIVFSNLHDGFVYVVDWEGGAPRKLSGGVAAGLWCDRKTGTIWVYGKQSRPGPGHAEAPIVRYQLDDPEKIETVWTKTDSNVVSPGNLQVSADGKKISAALPWPACGVAVLPDGAWSNNDRGCWPALAPDHSYLSWTFDGPHRNLYVHDPFAKRTWKVKIADAPGVDGWEVYHPRWSNHARVMTMTGPYNQGKENIKVFGGGAQVNVHLGRFAEDFRGIDRWVNLTRSANFGEFFPDVWVEGGDRYESALSRPGAPSPISLDLPPLSDRWPASEEGLVFLWENNRLGNRGAGTKLAKNAMAQAAGETRFGPDQQLWLHNGSARVEGFDESIAAAIKKSGEFSVEFVATSATPLQFGPRRLITFSVNRRDLNFYVGQNFDQFVFRLHTSETDKRGLEVPLTKIEAGRTYHVLVGYARGVLTCHVDGKVVVQNSAIRGNLSNWNEAAKLLFGDEWNAVDRQWSGLLEGVAIYDRKIGDEEAAKKAALYRKILASRSPRESWETELELMRRHEPPSLEQISPYRRALVLNLYKVLDDSPVADANGEVRVAEWILLDGKEPAANRPLRNGTRRKMRLERFDDHPQLESERMIGEPFDLDHVLYVEAFPGG